MLINECTGSVRLHMSVISQDGWSSLMIAAYWGKTEVVVELVKAGAKLNLQNTVCQCIEVYVHRIPPQTSPNTCMHVLM